MPNDLTGQFGHAQQNFEMGLFPELHRAWLIIDANFYMWAYDSSNDLSYYDGVTEPIIGVALVKPKPGVFREYIKYLLCLTTSVEIVAIGLTCDMEHGDVSNVLSLPEPFLVLPTDNVIMNVIQGTDNGRIFIGAKDGCLYEIFYQSEQTWFKKKCQKINHSKSTFSFLIPSLFNFADIDPIVQIEVDNSRHILYTRSEKGTIEVYDLGLHGDQMYKCASKTLAALASNASQIVKTIDLKLFKPIVHISAIEKSESTLINLVAITETGIRLYLSTSNYNRPDSCPCTLRLVHVRLPPGYTASSSSQRTNHVKLALHRKSNTILISQNEGRDILWTLNNDPFPFETQLMELYSAIPVQNKIWKLTEERRPQLCSRKALLPPGTIVPRTHLEYDLPELLTQEMEEKRKFVFLTSNGVHICDKPRPVDHFRQLLEDQGGFDNEAVKGFFMLYKETQACAIALNLACSSSVQDKLVAEWAKLAFFKYGGESQLNYPNPSAEISQFASSNQHNVPNPLGMQVSTPIQNMNRSLGLPQSPIQPLQSFVASSPYTSPRLLNNTIHTPTPNFANTPKPEASVQYSSKHTGLYLYFSRLVLPIWKHPMVVIRAQLGGDAILSTINPKELGMYLEKLVNLREFLVKNIQFTNTDVPSNYSFMNQLPAQVFTAQAYEKNSFYNLLQLITRCLEVLSLWKLLLQHDFSQIAGCLAKEYQMQLKSSTFRDMIVAGVDICGMLASSLVHKYIEDNSTTDAICRALNDSCPSIFKQENALLAKAHEIIARATNTLNKQEVPNLVAQAVTIFKNIGARINLEKACQLLESLHAFKDIVDLIIFISAARDKDNLANHFYKNAEPLDDKMGRAAFAWRIETYRILLEVYERLVHQSRSLIQSRSGEPSQQSPIKSLEKGGNSCPDTLTREEARSYAEAILNQVIASNDELLHNSFYDWLFEHQQREALLQIKSPFLESYLKRKAKVCGNQLAVLDLLWMYYEVNGNYRSAAHILDKLAESHASDIDLNKRIEYLSRAIMCMRSCPSHISKNFQDSDFGGDAAKTYGEFLHELEEKMEIAEIQLQILDNLQRLPEQPIVQASIVKLNTDLLGVTELYQDFAEKFDLPECMLAIMFCAGHYDPQLVETYWQRIFDKEFVELEDKPEYVQKMVICNKLDQLVRIYMNSEKFFPIGMWWALVIKFFETSLNL